MGCLFAIAHVLAGFAVAQSATTSIVSVSAAGVPGNGNSRWALVSADGRTLIFHSRATNLAPGDTNGARDVFVHELLTGRNRRLDLGAGGLQANADVRVTSISPEARFLALESEADNLVLGDANGHQDVYRHDLRTGDTLLVSVAADGGEADESSYVPHMSPDGRFVAFQSMAKNLVTGSNPYAPSNEVYLRDLHLGTTERVALNDAGEPANGSSSGPLVSARGRYVFFTSGATNLPNAPYPGRHVYVRDRVEGRTRLISVDSNGNQATGPGGGALCRAAHISRDGRIAVFVSTATNLAPGVAPGSFHVYSHDLRTGRTTIESIGLSGNAGNGNSFFPRISGDGRFVAFHSAAADLVPGDTNGDGDVFVRDRETGTTTRTSVGTQGQQGLYFSAFPDVSDGGGVVVFQGRDNGFAPTDRNLLDDVFVRILDL